MQGLLVFCSQVVLVSPLGEWQVVGWQRISSWDQSEFGLVLGLR